ncbi:hypothetical protein [Heyndrickxia coagulans]|uniref:hypothetical protein n=2 Tax=Heyndrickxia coagulans TaxID=1398 RepID=UPI000E5135A4|nr:hypothetical protein [Heyndrickxia coagulans]MED4934160.1 hypothetical protein [Heyndrickxia coagulans]MED4942591.1 hypothetical protein [Heyndrickxia coagulans]RGR97844.1 hypothetical protein DWY16_09525 [Heyndrickxia coagulans]
MMIKAEIIGSTLSVQKLIIILSQNAFLLRFTEPCTFWGMRLYTNTAGKKNGTAKRLLHGPQEVEKFRKGEPECAE